MWKEHAACENSDINFFTDNRRDFEEAVAICRDCPVRLQCAQYAIDRKMEEGIWGGVQARRLIYWRKSPRMKNVPLFEFITNPALSSFHTRKEAKPSPDEPSTASLLRGDYKNDKRAE